MCRLRWRQRIHPHKQTPPPTNAETRIRWMTTGDQRFNEFHRMDLLVRPTMTMIGVWIPSLQSQLSISMVRETDFICQWCLCVTAGVFVKQNALVASSCLTRKTCLRKTYTVASDKTRALWHTCVPLCRRWRMDVRIARKLRALFTALLATTCSSRLITPYCIASFVDVYNIEKQPRGEGGISRFVTALRQFADSNPLILFSGGLDCISSNWIHLTQQPQIHRRI